MSVKKNEDVPHWWRLTWIPYTLRLTTLFIFFQCEVSYRNNYTAYVLSHKWASYHLLGWYWCLTVSGIYGITLVPIIVYVLHGHITFFWRTFTLLPPDESTLFILDWLTASLSTLFFSCSATFLPSNARKINANKSSRFPLSNTKLAWYFRYGTFFN